MCMRSLNVAYQHRTIWHMVPVCAHVSSMCCVDELKVTTIVYGTIIGLWRILWPKTVKTSINFHSRSGSKNLVFPEKKNPPLPPPPHHPPPPPPPPSPLSSSALILYGHLVCVQSTGVWRHIDSGTDDDDDEFRDKQKIDNFAVIPHYAIIFLFRFVCQLCKMKNLCSSQIYTLLFAIPTHIVTWLYDHLSSCSSTQHTHIAHTREWHTLNTCTLPTTDSIS